MSKVRTQKDWRQGKAIDHKCKGCKREMGNHNSLNGACPVSRHRFTAFHNDQFFDPADEEPTPPRFSL